MKIKTYSRLTKIWLNIQQLQTGFRHFVETTVQPQMIILSLFTQLYVAANLSFGLVSNRNDYVYGAKYIYIYKKKWPKKLRQTKKSTTKPTLRLLQ